MQRTLTRDGREVCLQKWTGGIDYFRWQTSEFNDTDDLQRALREIQDKDRGRASNLRRWSFEGYRGWQTDTVRWGQRNGRVLWESSGSAAAATLDLSELCTGYASRIDTHCTLALSTPQPSFGTSLLGSISPTSTSRSSRLTQVGLHTATNGLWLGTVGKRTAPSYIRVYDKGVEARCAAPGVLWRIELEAKRQHARKLWLTNSQNLRQSAWCASYSVASLTSRGFSWPFGPLDDTSHDTSAGPKPKSTIQSLAAWLVLSVRPAVSRMLTVFTVAELLEMLGLSAVAAPIGKDNA
jgi:hypothetical protein